VDEEVVPSASRRCRDAEEKRPSRKEEAGATTGLAVEYIIWLIAIYGPN
jgi:hypothetical protein